MVLNGQGATVTHPPTEEPASWSPRARTITELPTSGILSNFDVEFIRQNPTCGSLLWTDFNSSVDVPLNTFKDTSSTIRTLGLTAIGEAAFFTTADNEAAEAQWLCPIIVSGGNKWAFGVRIKQSVLTNTKCGYFAGLMVGTVLTGDMIVDGATLQTEGSIGFQLKEADGDKIDFVYDTTGQSQVEYDDDYITQVDDEYNTLEMYFNGTTIQAYADGVASGTAIPAASIALATFPAALVMCPIIALKAGHADDFTVTVDWMYAIQHGT